MKNQRLHILGLVSYNFLPARMGGQKGIASFYEFYARKVKLYCATVKSNDPSAAGYEVSNFISDAPTRYANPFYFFPLRKMIREKQITHLQIEHPYWGWLAVALKYACRIPLIVHSHNIEGLRFRSLGKSWWKLIARYEKWVHRHADYNLFISDEDRQYALTHFGLNQETCLTATYGIDWNAPPAAEERSRCRQLLLNKYKLDAETQILLFNGTFSYGPNLEGLRTIINQINPILAGRQIPYAIFVCGKNIPSEIAEGNYPNIFIEGFVEDIGLYFKGADVFLNPISEGGGIKTKLVEALGYDLFAVSYTDGAIGIPRRTAEGKLHIASGPEDFAEKVAELNGRKQTLNGVYFEHFYWGNIIDRVVSLISKRA